MIARQALHSMLNATLNLDSWSKTRCGKEMRLQCCRNPSRWRSCSAAVDYSHIKTTVLNSVFTALGASSDQPKERSFRATAVLDMFANGSHQLCGCYRFTSHYRVPQVVSLSLGFDEVVTKDTVIALNQLHTDPTDACARNVKHADEARPVVHRSG